MGGVNDTSGHGDEVEGVPGVLEVGLVPEGGQFHHAFHGKEDSKDQVTVRQQICVIQRSTMVLQRNKKRKSKDRLFTMKNIDCLVSNLQPLLFTLRP